MFWTEKTWWIILQWIR